MTTPNEFEAEDIVAKCLGKGYRVAKINGYWVIGHDSKATDHSFGRVSPDPLRKSLDKAIGDILATKI